LESPDAHIPGLADDPFEDVVQPLPLDTLEGVLPGIQGLLEPFPLAPHELRKTDHPVVVPLAYTKLAPTRADFWQLSSENEPVARHGCFPITSMPSTAHYEAVVDTQVHLKKLGMLHKVEGDDYQRIREQLNVLPDPAGRIQSKRATLIGKSWVEALLEGLTRGKITIYKGLDTSMGTHNREDHFWGASYAREEEGPDCFDIYLSLKVPAECEATTILHTWLAHHGVRRLERYVMETELEAKIEGRADSAGLPLSIVNALEEGTTSELLFICEQIRVSPGEMHDDPFQAAIVQRCEHLLLDRSSRASWRKVHSLSLLDGSISIRGVLQKRLAHYVDQGAVALPNLDNLVHLFKKMDKTVCDALFAGNRDTLTAIVEPLHEAVQTSAPGSGTPIDLNVDLLCLMFFSILRREAFHDVYLETTDRCPYFLSQPDQAAVFSELWILGSQCEIYFGIVPRELGLIIFKKYEQYLAQNPPTEKEAGDGFKNAEGTLTVYADPSGCVVEEPDEPAGGTMGAYESLHTAPAFSRARLREWKRRILDFGAMSIFCLPAIVDVVLLTLLGRGMFVTAFMKPAHILAAGYAVLTALLISAGVTGWVASIGQYYMPHYAYDNMVYFHVQRLAGGFILTLAVAAVGFAAFMATHGFESGLVFVAYIIGVNSYLMLLGVMATMHQPGSPLTSGRTVLWRTLPILFIAPIVSIFCRGHDLEVYLPVMYGFVLLLLVQYRRLCCEWAEWLDNIPKITEKDVGEWFTKKEATKSQILLASKSAVTLMADSTVMGEEDDDDEAPAPSPDSEFRKEVYARIRARILFGGLELDPLAMRVAKAMPFINWLMRKDFPNGGAPPQFTTAWFNALNDVLDKQLKLRKGLKEHNILMLFRVARYDIALNVGLFLVALMDRWVAMVNQGRSLQLTMYTDFRARYGLCLAILYFCLAVMALDTTLSRYWSERWIFPQVKLTGIDHARESSQEWLKRRRTTYHWGLFRLFLQLLFVSGITTFVLWLCVNNTDTFIIYGCYVLGYSCVVIFQFNRCFASDVGAHTIIMYSSALAGFIVGNLFRALPWTSTLVYNDILAMDTAAVLCAVLTTIWSWRGLRPAAIQKSAVDASAEKSADEDDKIFKQRLIVAPTQGTILARKPLASPKRNWKKLMARKVVVTDGTPLHASISQMLEFYAPNHSRKTEETLAQYMDGIVHQASRMWSVRLMKVSFVDKARFASVGFGDCASVSKVNKKGQLDVVIGILNREDIGKESWTSSSAIM
jgi:hypothetical protein